LKVFEAARWFDPERAGSLSQQSILTSLEALPFLKRELVNKMIDELPTYLALLGLAPDLELYWRNNSRRLPAWSEAAFLVSLLQPSSGCVERAFSLLRNLFTDRQRSTLEDYIEGSVKLAYNERQRAGVKAEDD
jgi:hypothetical protein